MKIETTTQLLPILDLSMYESYLSPDFVFSSQREGLSYENKEETDFDFDEYKKAVCKLADKFMAYFIFIVCPSIPRNSTTMTLIKVIWTWKYLTNSCL